MGRDKSLVELEGLSFAERVRRALGEVVDEVWLSLREGQTPPLDGLRVVRDAGEGPLGGVAAALDALPTGAVLLAVACDMPLVTPAALRDLLHALDDHDAAVPVCGGVDQVACAAWSWRGGPAAGGVLVVGVRAPRDVLAAIDVVRIDASDRDLELRSFDAPADLGPHRGRSRSRSDAD